MLTALEEYAIDKVPLKLFHTTDRIRYMCQTLVVLTEIFGKAEYMQPFIAARGLSQRREQARVPHLEVPGNIMKPFTKDFESKAASYHYVARFLDCLLPQEKPISE